MFVMPYCCTIVAMSLGMSLGLGTSRTWSKTCRVFRAGTKSEYRTTMLIILIRQVPSCVTSCVYYSAILLVGILEETESGG